MTDIVDSATRSRMMSGIKGKDTVPEIFLRKALHAQGFRYRLGGAGLPGRPDLVFPALRTVIFINGCFWHRHACSYFKWPKNNGLFWKEKLDKNVARDKLKSQALVNAGWRVLTVWECELRGTRYTLPNPAVSRVIQELSAQRNVVS